MFLFLFSLILKAFIKTLFKYFTGTEELKKAKNLAIIGVNSTTIALAEAFLNDNSVEVVNLYVDVVNPRYALHKWDTVKIFVKGEEQKLSDAINSATTMLRLKRINKLIIKNNNTSSKTMKTNIELFTRIYLHSNLSHFLLF